MVVAEIAMRGKVRVGLAWVAGLAVSIAVAWVIELFLDPASRASALNFQTKAMAQVSSMAPMEVIGDSWAGFWRGFSQPDYRIMRILNGLAEMALSSVANGFFRGLSLACSVVFATWVCAKWMLPEHVTRIREAEALRAQAKNMNQSGGVPDVEVRMRGKVANNDQQGMGNLIVVVFPASVLFGMMAISILSLVAKNVAIVSLSLFGDFIALAGAASIIGSAVVPVYFVLIKGVEKGTSSFLERMVARLVLR